MYVEGFSRQSGRIPPTNSSPLSNHYYFTLLKQCIPYGDNNNNNVWHFVPSINEPLRGQGASLRLSLVIPLVIPLYCSVAIRAGDLLKCLFLLVF